VDRLEGRVLVLKTPTGQEIKLDVTDETRIRAVSPAQLADLTPGSTVRLQGIRTDNGSMTAESIIKQP
jgi:hypothetical protein